MKLKLTKSAIFSLITSCSIFNHKIQAGEENQLQPEDGIENSIKVSILTEEQNNNLAAIHGQIARLVKLTEYLVLASHDPKGSKKFDILVIYMESLLNLFEKVKQDIENQSKEDLAKENPTYSTILKLEQEVVGSVAKILGDLSKIIRETLVTAAESAKKSGRKINATAFMLKLKAPAASWKETSRKASVTLKVKIERIAQLLAHVGSEHTELTDKLLEFINKLTTQKPSNAATYIKIGQKLIPSHTPFEGLKPVLVDEWESKINNN